MDILVINLSKNSKFNQDLILPKFLFSKMHDRNSRATLFNGCIFGRFDLFLRTEVIARYLA